MPLYFRPSFSKFDENFLKYKIMRITMFILCIFVKHEECLKVSFKLIMNLNLNLGLYREDYLQYVCPFDHTNIAWSGKVRPVNRLTTQD